MTPIATPVAELKPALVGIAKLISSRSPHPALQCIKIDRTTEGWIVLTTTDTDHFITVRLEQPAEGKPLSLLVPFEALVDLVKNSSKDARINFLPDPDKSAVIVAFSTPGKVAPPPIKVPPVAEFPAIPRITTPAVQLLPTLRKSIHEAMACTSDDPTRLILHGAFIDASEPKNHHVIATDGRHLYSSNSFNLPLKNSVLIPKHKFLGWREFNNDGEWALKDSPQWVQLNSRRWRFITKQLEGRYPNWRQVVPDQQPKTIITLEPDALEALADTIEKLPYHDETNQTIGLELKERQLHLLAKKEIEAPWIRVPAKAQEIKGMDLTVFVNRQYLIKALRFGLNTIGLIDEISPLRFSNQGKLMIAMPLRPDGINSPAQSSPRSRPTMKAPQPSPQPLTINTVIESVHQVRDSFIAGVNKLKDLGIQLKHLQREQKNSNRELNSVRSTLRSLQGMKV